MSWDLFSGVPVGFQVLFWVVLAITVSSFFSIIVLTIAGVRFRRLQRGTEDPDAEREFLWVFLVPALNEEVTIADSVSRLRASLATHKVVLVIDDGSEDSTGEILAGLAGPDLRVLTRVAPNAPKGQGGRSQRRLQLHPRAAAHRTRIRVLDARSGDRRCCGRRRSPRHRHAAARRSAIRRGGARRRAVPGAHLQPRQLPDLGAGCRVPVVRAGLPVRAGTLGHCEHGRQRPVQPAHGARFGRRPGRSVAGSTDRGPGPGGPDAAEGMARIAADRGRGETSRACRACGGSTANASGGRRAPGRRSSCCVTSAASRPASSGASTRSTTC